MWAQNDPLQVKLKLVKIIRHPEFKKDSKEYDVAIAQLDRDLDLNGKEKHIGTRVLHQPKIDDSTRPATCTAGR